MEKTELKEKIEKKEEGKRIVVPGELLSTERKKLGQNVFVNEGKIYSTCVGLLTETKDFISVVPLEGIYIPKPNDLIVGIISSVKYSGYMVNINSIYESFISKSDLRENLKEGAIISAKVMKVDELNEATLSQIRLFYGGELLVVSPVKVPRIIGKNSSMLNVIKDNTKTNIMVGRNGLIWLNGGRKDLAIKAIKLIEAEAHLSNLTNKVEEFLKNAIKVSGKEVKK